MSAVAPSSSRPSFGTWLAAGYANAALPRRADPSSLQRLDGRTMGTTWSLRFDNPSMLPLDDVRATVDSALARVIAQMSHWETESDISRFNRAPAGSRHVLAAEFCSVMGCALRWAQASGGAIDPTVAPLVACWGFGPDGTPDGNATPPQPHALAQTRRRVGWQRLGFDPAQGSILQPGDAVLDLSGIAKGFAVDHGVDGLKALGLTNHLFEVGGELRAAGLRPGGLPWQVQVEGAEGATQIISLTDTSVATSGDRWHTREHAGRRWSHTIDPRIGQPVDGSLASVTVVHPECMQADALATVLTVLGAEDGEAFAEEHRIAAQFTLRRDGGDVIRSTAAWKALA